MQFVLSHMCGLIFDIGRNSLIIILAHLSVIRCAETILILLKKVKILSPFTCPNPNPASRLSNY